MDMHSVDVLIPACRPGREFDELLQRLSAQTVQPRRILVINTEKCWWEECQDTETLKGRFPALRVCHIRQSEFDHGGTRHLGMEHSRAEFVLCMTQDALPADEFLIEKLLRPFEEEKVAVSYARQLPREDASMIETFTRRFNYPKKPRLKGKEDIPVLGIKTYACSNVCAMYRKSVYEELGGFVRHTIFNEDMIYAAGAVQAGFLVAYAADARVFHSHNYTGLQQFHRNFDLGVSQADHPEVFAEVASEGEGIRLVENTARYLLRQKKPWLLLALVWQSGWKYLGYWTGKHYKWFSKRQILRFTANKSYWKSNSDTN